MDTYTTVTIASGLLSQLPKLDPKTAVFLSRFAPAETSELVRRLRELDSEPFTDAGLGH